MKADRKVEPHGGLQCLLQNLRLHDRDTVIGETCGACLSECIKIDSLFAAHTHSDIGAAVEMDFFFFSAFENVLQNGDTVHGGIGVGHQDDTGVSPARCGKRPGVQILFPQKARIPEVGVRVDQTGSGAESRPVDYLQRGILPVLSAGSGAFFGGDIVFDFCKAAVFNENICFFLHAGGGVVQEYIFDKKHMYPPFAEAAFTGCMLMCGYRADPAFASACSLL